MSGEAPKAAKKKQRSRLGCRRCKKLKVKCDEKKPNCSLCVKTNQICDYSLVLTWGGRPFKDAEKMNQGFSTVVSFNKKSEPNQPTNFYPVNPQTNQFTIVQENFPPIPPRSNAVTTSTEQIVKRGKKPKTPDSDSNSNPNLKFKYPDIEIRSDLLSDKFTHTIPFNTKSFLSDIADDTYSFSYNVNQHAQINRQSLALDYQMKFIPTSITPLPDLLLENPSLREYYHSYIQIFSKLLSPANPCTYTENPFTVILPRISISAGTDGVLCALIATSVLHTSVCQNKPYPEAEINNLLSHSLNDLYNRLTDEKEANSDYTLALILFLSFFENFRGKLRGWRAHYNGAKKIILSKGFLKELAPKSGPSNALEPRKFSFDIGHETDLTFFFSRWFAYLDVIGALCSASSIYTSSESRNLLIWKAPTITEFDRINLKDIDLLMGFDF